jgi:hypothetical protein
VCDLQRVICSNRSRAPTASSSTIRRRSIL